MNSTQKNFYKRIFRFIYSTNHKDIGVLYILFARFAGIVGTLMSVLIRFKLDLLNIFFAGFIGIIDTLSGFNNFLITFLIRINIFYKFLFNKFYKKKKILKKNHMNSTQKKIYKRIVSFIYSTNHKNIGVFYILFAGFAGIVGTLMSVLIRFKLGLLNIFFAGFIGIIGTLSVLIRFKLDLLNILFAEFIGIIDTLSVLIRFKLGLSGQKFQDTKTQFCINIGETLLISKPLLTPIKKKKKFFCHIL
jgi:hypothetical protein